MKFRITGFGAFAVIINPAPDREAQDCNFLC